MYVDHIHHLIKCTDKIENGIFFQNISCHQTKDSLMYQHVYISISVTKELIKDYYRNLDGRHYNQILRNFLTTTKYNLYLQNYCYIINNFMTYIGFKKEVPVV